MDLEIGTQFFFDASVKEARNRNGVDKLIDDVGSTHRAKSSKGKVAMEYFFQIVKSSSPTDLHSFKHSITSKMNELLTKEVSKDEVRRDVLQLNLLAPLVQMGCRVCFSSDIGML